MDRKLSAVRNVISEIESLNRGVGGDVIDPSDVLSRKITKFMESLATVHEEGRSMNESSMIQIPLALFDHLDNHEGSNPELYQMLMMEEAEQRAGTLKQKIENHTILRGELEKAAKSTTP